MQNVKYSGAFKVVICASLVFTRGWAEICKCARPATLRQVFKTVPLLVLIGSVGLSQSESQEPPRPCQDVREIQKRLELAEEQNRYWKILSYFQRQNDELLSAKANTALVIFMGDSILGSWYLPQDFPSKPFVNRAIGGQNTLQMLARFRSDVIRLKPSVVVIEGGTNDLRYSQSPEMIQVVKDNLASMVDVARAGGIKVVVGSIPPISAMRGEAGAGSPITKAILIVNSFLRSYAEQTGQQYLDTYSLLVDANGGMRGDLTNDGLHPNAKGYKVMAPVALNAINKALAGR